MSLRESFWEKAAIVNTVWDRYSWFFFAVVLANVADRFLDESFREVWSVGRLGEG